MKRQELKWTLVRSCIYQFPVEEGQLEAMFGVSEEPRDRFYCLTLKNRGGEKIAQATIYIDSGLNPTEGDIKRLLKYSHLVEEVKGIPDRRKPGFKALIGELQETR